MMRSFGYGVITLFFFLGVACSDDTTTTDAQVADAAPPSDGASDTSSDGGPEQDAPSTDTGTDVTETDTTAGARQLCLEICSGTGRSTCMPSSSCIDGRCVYQAKTYACVVDRDCVPVASMWLGSDACASSEDCSLIEACIDVNGGGLCVLKPTEVNPTRCSNFIGGKDITWPSIEGPDVIVCGRDNYLCNSDKVCEKGCDADDDCSGNTPSCNLPTNRCVCTANSCTSSSKGRSCLASGSCGCSDDTHCPDSGFDKCYGDQCGCADSASCAAMLPDFYTVCEVPPTP
ncbi:MAG: hypothetical protein JRH20_23970 [Deltaproteobacteria bacterium]|nr:hypothetical protein [Deltaproteobacteria bacterium]